MSLVSRRRVSYRQLEELWEKLNVNRSLATGYNKTAQARESSRRMWETVAGILNAFGDGATKDWKGWCKYWNDYKSKLKSRVAAIRASHLRTGGGPSDDQALSDLEKKFLQILGEDFGTGIPDARVEPFDIAAVDHTSQREGSESLLLQWPPLPLTSPILGEISGNDGHEHESPVTPPAQTPAPPTTPRRSPRLMSRHNSPSQPSASQRTLQRILMGIPRQRQTTGTPRRAPIGHRQRRGEPLMSQQAARRALVADSQERTNLSRDKLVILNNLVEEFKEIKNILNSRLPLPATNAE